MTNGIISYSKKKSKPTKLSVKMDANLESGMTEQAFATAQQSPLQKILFESKVLASLFFEIFK